MPALTIDRIQSLSYEEIDFLTEQMNEEAQSLGIFTEAFPFSFSVRGACGNILAGCQGALEYGAIYTDKLWVHPDCRNQGLGRVMMEKVHSLGRESGCALAAVLTMNFQGTRRFYEQLGYVCDLERPGYANNSVCLFLKKAL